MILPFLFGCHALHVAELFYVFAVLFFSNHLQTRHCPGTGDLAAHLQSHRDLIDFAALFGSTYLTRDALCVWSQAGLE